MKVACPNEEGGGTGSRCDDASNVLLHCLKHSKLSTKRFLQLLKSLLILIPGISALSTYSILDMDSARVTRKTDKTK